MNNPFTDMIDGRPIEPAFSKWEKATSKERAAMTGKTTKTAIPAKKTGKKATKRQSTSKRG